MNTSAYCHIYKTLQDYYKDTYYQIVSKYTEYGGQFGLCLNLVSDICNLIDIKNTTYRFIEKLENRENLEIRAAITDIVHLDQIYAQTQYLRENLAGLIEIPEKVFSVADRIPREKITYNMPDLEIWETLFQSGRQDILSTKISDYLSRLAQRKKVSSFVLKMFRMDIEQLVYRYLSEQHVEMYKLFDEKEAEELCDLSIQSVDYMKQYAGYLITKSIEYAAMTEKTDSIITRVREYLDDHYQMPVTRNDLANVVYLNPDYLSRLFKKEMNTSINAYIIDKRIDRAKVLLEHSDMPVHAVSMEVGYSNFSYFTKLFHEKTGRTPNEFRRAGE